MAGRRLGDDSTRHLILSAMTAKCQLLGGAWCDNSCLQQQWPISHVCMSVQARGAQSNGCASMHISMTRYAEARRTACYVRSVLTYTFPLNLFTLIFLESDRSNSTSLSSAVIRTLEAVGSSCSCFRFLKGCCELAISPASSSSEPSMPSAEAVVGKPSRKALIFACRNPVSAQGAK